MDAHDATLDALWERLDSAADAPRSQRDTELRPVVAAIRDYVASHEDDADAWYILGYALYCHTARTSSPAIERECAHALRRALELRPGDARAMPYLGYNAYDVGLIDEALAWFERAEPDRRDDFARAKNLEMRAACVVRLRGLDAALDLLRALAEHCACLAPEDVFPLTLGPVLERVWSHASREARDAAGPHLRRIDDAAGGGWFRWLRE